MNQVCFKGLSGFSVENGLEGRKLKAVKSVNCTVTQVKNDSLL